jgi:hypothetical protein
MSRDLKKMRDALRKVIAYMTLGIDVSRLFGEVVLTSGMCNDLIVKKMVYHYICHYAESNSELAILAINTLVKDSYVARREWGGAREGNEWVEGGRERARERRQRESEQEKRAMGKSG